MSITLEKIRNRICWYGVHPTAAELNEVMKDIKQYKEISKPSKMRDSKSYSDIQSGPYWGKIKELEQ
tara:strand:+ start:952 stop:1152 length:201 start_codon:yes stop_codon:yes gene_type:complete